MPKLVLLSGLVLLASVLQVCSQRECLPRIVVSTFVRATVYRTGTGVSPLLPVCTLTDFRGRIGKDVAANIDLPEGCSLLSLSDHSCRQSGRRFIVEYNVNITCNEDCVLYENAPQFRRVNREHRAALVTEVRRRQTEEITVQGERVRLEYKRGRKTYFDECLGGVANSIGNHFTCYCRDRVCGCPGDTEFSGCGSRCPRTCATIGREPLFCPAVCVEGCFCPDGLVRLGDKCIVPADCPNSICTLPPDAGSGFAVLKHYHYNSTSQRCEEFPYSGCGGNENVFSSKRACRARCSDPRCRGDHVFSSCPTSCGVSCENYFFDRPLCGGFCFEGCGCPPLLIPLTSDPDNTDCVRPDECSSRLCPPTQSLQRCGSRCGITCENIHLPERFQPVCALFCRPGCFCKEGLIPLGPNSDKCVPRGECSTAVCTQETEMFPCLIPEERYRYNGDTGRCEQFMGCPGRGNNFDSPKACKNICEAPPDCTAVFCLRPACSEPITNPGQCCDFCPEDPVDCSAVLCLVPECDNPVTPPGQCCAICPETTVDTTPSVPSPSPRPTRPPATRPGAPAPPTLPQPPRPVPPTLLPPPILCPRGKIFNRCGTACPLTCDRPVVSICTLQCVTGCFCPEGLVELGNRCVRRSECPNDLCRLSSDPGPCRGSIPRYYYNKDTQRCEVFIYGGCRGNDNNFRTLEDCRQRCPETDCPGDRVYTTCGSACPTTCDNKDILRICPAICVEGCFCPSGTVELGDRCVEPDDCPSFSQCLEPIETGPCHASIPSWGYNRSTGQCEKFFYGGCRGNDNRFCSKDECDYVCDCSPGEDCGCLGDTVYTDCGSRCPLTCETLNNRPQFCPLLCVPGCFCPDGLVRHGDKCIPPADCPNSICTLPPETGTGLAVLKSYHYNSDNQRCERFLYSGCDGNANQFFSKKECQLACSDPRCRGDHVYSDCATSCGISCENHDLPPSQRPVCTALCFEGCSCPPGLIPLTSDPDNTDCVRPDECSSRLCPAPGQEFSRCGSRCGITCENLHLPERFQPVCAPFCSRGCFCKEGFVPLGPNSDKCVPREECSTAVCIQETGVFPCLIAEEHYRYNETTGRCEQFIGCPGGGNNFRTLIACQDVCEARPDCSAVLCALPDCDNPITNPGQCCAFCPDGSGSPPPLPPGPLESLPPPPGPSSGSPPPPGPSSGSPPPPEPECPEGKVYKLCGSACPLTCDSHDSIIPCSLQCVQGCFCPDGLVELGDKCVHQSQCPNDLCMLPSDSGPCEAAIRRYYFNSKTQRCESFIYGGCRGNDNNFRTLEACQERCPETICQGDRVYTTCGSACPTTCDNKDSPIGCIKICVEGCFCPNGTVELGDRCVEPDDCPSFSQCLEPIDPGPCRASIPSWGYNAVSGRCERFIYGGCRGNDNRFCTREECDDVCDPCTIADCEEDEDCVMELVTRRVRCVPSCTRGNPCPGPQRCILDPVLCLNPPCRPLRSCVLDCRVVFCAEPDPDECDNLIPRDPRRGICCSICLDDIPTPTPPTRPPVPRPTVRPSPRPIPSPTPVDCSAVLCAAPFCEFGRLFTPPGECCPVCTLPCDEGVTPVNCLVDPCVGARCRGFPDAHCVSDYCEGCNARWFDEDGNELQCGVDCSTVPCPDLDCDPDMFEMSADGCCLLCPRDCLEVECPQIRCRNSIPANFSAGRCCPTCPDVPTDPCATVRCRSGHQCEVYEPTGEAYCNPNCSLNPCRTGDVCEVQPVFCVRDPCPGILRCRVDCNLVDCRDITPADCGGAAIVSADPRNGRCCDTCDLPTPSPSIPPPIPPPTAVRPSPRPTIRPPRPTPTVDCSEELCAIPFCEFGSLFTPPGQCCSVCTFPCDEGVTPVNCLVDPCVGARCHGFPDAHCVSDYCEGCNARWFDEGGNELQCGVDCNLVDCHDITPTDCGGAAIVPADPRNGRCCDTCDLPTPSPSIPPPIPRPTAVRPSPRPTIRPPRPTPTVDCSEELCAIPFCEFGSLFTPPGQCCSVCTLPCDEGVTPVNCLVDPCVGARCRGFSDAHCVSDYCEGCDARWFDRNGREVQCEASDSS